MYSPVNVMMVSAANGAGGATGVGFGAVMGVTGGRVMAGVGVGVGDERDVMYVSTSSFRMRPPGPM